MTVGGWNPPRASRPGPALPIRPIPGVTRAASWVSGIALPGASLAITLPSPISRSWGAISSRSDAARRIFARSSVAATATAFPTTTMIRLAIVAPELTHASLLAAIQQRRAYAIRGGQPILLDFRVDDHFMGDVFTSTKPPRVRLKAKGSKPARPV